MAPMSKAKKRCLKPLGRPLSSHKRRKTTPSKNNSMTTPMSCVQTKENQRPSSSTQAQVNSNTNTNTNIRTGDNTGSELLLLLKELGGLRYPVAESKTETEPEYNAKEIEAYWEQFRFPPLNPITPVSIPIPISTPIRRSSQEIHNNPPPKTTYLDRNKNNTLPVQTKMKVPVEEEEQEESEGDNNEDEESRVLVNSNSNLHPSIDEVTKAWKAIKGILKPRRTSSGIGIEHNNPMGIINKHNTRFRGSGLGLGSILECRLNAMQQLFWVYIDCKSDTYNKWTESCLKITQINARGVSWAENLSKWGYDFVEDHTKLPVTQHGRCRGRKSLVNNEDFKRELNSYFQTTGLKNKRINCQTLVAYVAKQDVQERYNLTTGISIATARNWLIKLGYWSVGRGT